MQTTSYSDFCNNVSGYVNSVMNDYDTLLVNRDAENAAVLMSLNEYNSIMETLYLMSSPETMADIRKAEADLKSGKGIEVKIEDL